MVKFSIFWSSLGPFLGVERGKTCEKLALQVLEHPKNVAKKTWDLRVSSRKTIYAVR